MAKPAVRIQVVQVGLLAGLVAVLGRAAQVQLGQGARWAAEARQARTERVTLEARRGTVFDRHGTPIALTQETYHVGVAPNELRETARDAAVLARALRLPLREVQAELRRRYAYFDGPYSALEVQSIRDLRGVHLEPVLDRFYPDPTFARAIVGRVGTDGRGASGLEKTFDSLLAGTPGAAVVLKDRAGREYESPARLIASPVAGADLVLTLDGELQEIAQRALADALDRMDAEGGDVVMLDPASGEVLAVASLRRDGSAPPTAFTATFEPGSVAKVFTAAALLSLERVSSRDRVSGEGGHYKLPSRTLTDEHPLPSLTLADAIRVSSNIAMAKFSTRLSSAEQYQMLRAFGLGGLTGIEYPAEAPGRLRSPPEWSGTSAVALAIGYEVAVTPLQLAAAYGAIANGGVLLAPTLIREVRSPAGEILYRHRPEPVRRVISDRVARQLLDFLTEAVERGTGSEATLANFQLAAKTGTARRVVQGRYAKDEVTTSFAAVFPADEPQLVVVVKIVNPQRGGRFAAQTAAPVTRVMLEQALAARTVALDRARLSGPRAEAQPALLEDGGGVVPYVASWPFAPDSGIDTVRRTIPDVRGQSLREAARALHRRGFHVSLRGWGSVEHTYPAAGESARAGSLVVIFAEERP